MFDARNEIGDTVASGNTPEALHFYLSRYLVNSCQRTAAVYINNRRHLIALIDRGDHDEFVIEDIQKDADETSEARYVRDIYREMSQELPAHPREVIAILTLAAVIRHTFRGNVDALADCLRK